MKTCSCALPALTGDTKCCERCNNNSLIESASSFKTKIIWTTPNDDDINRYEKQNDDDINRYEKQNTLNNIKKQIDFLTIKEIKELYEYIKKFEPILK